MDVYLANKVPVSFSEPCRLILNRTDYVPTKNYVRSSTVPVELSPVDENNFDGLPKLKQNLLAGNFSGSSSCRKRKSGGSLVQEYVPEPWAIEMDLGIYASTTTEGDSNGIPNSSNAKGYIRVTDRRSKGILKNLCTFYRQEELKLTILVENLKNTSQEEHIILSQLMSITDENLMCIKKRYGAIKMELNVDCDCDTIVGKWIQDTNDDTWKANVTIIAVLPDDKSAVDSSVPDKWCLTKKILLEQLFTDVTIIAQNGVGVKCHKVFLVGHSPVLAAMFRITMQESQTDTVEMPDMSEASVLAFLAFLYYWETKEAENCSLICFELFAAGHKYDINTLENCMEKILLAKNSGWYDVDVAIKLFLFSRGLLSGEKLKMIAVQVLKLKLIDLKKSSCYQQLFTNDPKAAMELCRYAFSV